MIASRIDNPTTVDRPALEKLLRDGASPVIQFSKPGYDESLLRSINQLCGEFGSKIEVRFYGHYGSHFDATSLRFLPEVGHLSVDCLRTITGIETIGTLQHLRSLSLGIHELDRPEVLDAVPLENLESLRLCETRKADMQLGPLKRCRCLRDLHIAGHTRGIEVLAELDSVHRLTLRSIPKKQSLEVVSHMRGLRNLGLILGGRESIDEISHAQLTDLEVVWVRGLSSLGNLSRFASLENLRIEDQLRLLSLDLTHAAPRLRTLAIVNCKKLSAIFGLHTLACLETLTLARTAIDLEDLARTGFPRSLKRVRVYTGTKSGDEAATGFMAALGYETA